jgi:hypothetical protein
VVAILQSANKLALIIPETKMSGLLAKSIETIPLVELAEDFQSILDKRLKSKAASLKWNRLARLVG